MNHKRAHEEALRQANQAVPGGAQAVGPTTSTTTTKTVSSSTTNESNEEKPNSDDVPATEEEESLEEMFTQLSSHGADYLRQLGAMITNALEAVDQYVIEGEEGEERRAKEAEERAAKQAAEAKKKPTEESWDLLRDGVKEDPNGPDVESSLQKMIEMGYSNAGGWLKKLLQEKDGDVDEALKVLEPPNAKVLPCTTK